MDLIWETLHEFVVDYCEFLPGHIPELNSIPKPNVFVTDYVLTNLPFVVRCEESEHFPAVALWDDQKHVRKLMEKKMVTAAVTPDGRADSVVDGRFMIPEERTMLFDKFFDELFQFGEQVFYLQKQNNNLFEECAPLLRDVPAHVPWATEAFGSEPDAANVWIGNCKSVTSIHKDNYENIYCVITGHKKFFLYPPVSMGWMPYKKYKKFQWYFEDEHGSRGHGTWHGTWHMKDLNEEVEWIEPSHKPASREQFKMFANTKSYVVDVYPGDVLYIPALWFHEVHQTSTTIAVNYWYDMKYDMRYPFLKLFKELCNLKNSCIPASVDIQTELEDSLFDVLHERQKEFLPEKLKKEISEHKRLHK